MAVKASPPRVVRMDTAELTALLTPEGLRLLDAAGSVASSDEVARTVSHLRAAGHSPELVSAVVGQARLRAKAKAKFGDFAERMLFTRSGLEQSTRLAIAARHAARFRDAGITTVADLGCGIGGDTMGLAALGLRVHAVDADEATAALAAYNLAPFGESVTVRHDTAESVDLEGVEAVWLDPARRTSGHTETRRVSSADYSPPLDWAFALLARMPGGMKLGPGFDREAIPESLEAQWVSAEGSTVELVLWSGRLAREGVRRAALVMRGDRSWEITSAGDAEDVAVRPLGAFVHEPEGAVIRARLIGDVARALDAGVLAPGIAYLTSDAAVTSPFVASFRVREEVPFETRSLAKALRERGIGTLEIKKRGVDVDPAALRTKLRLHGSESATLLLTRVGSRRLALLADRVS